VAVHLRLTRTDDISDRSTVLWRRIRGNRATDAFWKFLGFSIP